MVNNPPTEEERVPHRTIQRGSDLTRHLCLWCLGSLVLALAVKPGWAQETVGRRLFSDQLVISEPFVEDELTLPSLLHIRRPRTAGEPDAPTTQIGAELKKRLTPDLEVSVSGGLTHLHPDGASSLTGFDNLEVGLKYQLLRDPAGEAVASVALGWEVGGTGRAATGAESFATLSPALLFGKGFGDLPETLASLKPFAVAGLLGMALPTRASSRELSVDTGEVSIHRHPNLLKWGLLLEYSLPYLESFVNDLGLPPPLSGLVPLVELDLQTALDRGAGGKTTGTANAGAVWVGRSIQIGFEAVVPINERSGKNVGVRGFVRLDLELILGERAGRPIFGGTD